MTLSTVRTLAVLGLLAPAMAPTAVLAQSTTPHAPAAAVTQVQYAVEDDDDMGDVEATAMARCAAQFRSFNPDTGTYITYGGDEVLCPYLQE